MKNLNELNHFRRTTPDVIKLWGFIGDHTAGVFDFPIRTHATRYLKIIVTSGEGWDHVSVSLLDRCPTWEEMDKVKRAFFLDTETVMQLHVAAKAHINVHQYCLHLWRPHTGSIPLPPAIMVG